MYVYIGYYTNSKSYRLFNLTIEKIVIIVGTLILMKKLKLVEVDYSLYVLG